MSHRLCFLVYLCMAVGACTDATPAAPVVLRIDATAEGTCTTSLDGRVLDAEQMIEALKRRGTREVHLIGMDLTVPYRCIGGVIYALQAAKVPMNVGFISEPPGPIGNAVAP